MTDCQKITRNFKGIIDSTLREGWQFCQANFSERQLLQVFRYLCMIGVEYVELSNPARKEVFEIVKKVVNLKRKENSKTKILAHVRNKKEDVEKALEAGTDGVNILCTADTERIAALNLSFHEYINQLEKNLEFACRPGLEVRVSVEDTFNQPQELVNRVFAAACNFPILRIGVSDTLGKALPWDVKDKISRLRERFSVDIEVHFHNDLGNAVSNSLSALRAGANWVDTSLLGIGERTGITPLGTFLVNLYCLDTELTRRYNLKVITEAENYLARICRIDFPINLITNPKNAFAHKAGIHLNALINFGPHKYEPIPPGLIGNRRRMITNTLVSGRTTELQVEEFLKRFGDA